MSTTYQAASPAQLNHTAAKIFNHIMDKWQINENERPRLASLNSEDYARWHCGELLSGSSGLPVLVSHLMAIHTLLHQMFHNAEQADSWITRPNSNLNGQSAIELIQQQGVTGAVKVRDLLEANVF
ncbi:Protein of unknown function [Rheinheimera pacifica]|uniref:Antitoxin Xre/MbcA/ParS-like toxin-binding domain-containing protein n=1 Tax=Rheinheimera pacifica TaxID=173990 RepID=A0A1H6NDD9_9GAMM|nr:MbcA/ParS/Xre antitoxin family protein [Rheinheimera pacifica]SEI13082.1 Protein of unknown function [Rheinheimera pacifica]